MEKDWYGATLILKEQVICNDEDEDLKLYRECCEKVCKMIIDIEKDQLADGKE